jgi:hypothetical protein
VFLEHRDNLVLCFHICWKGSTFWNGLYLWTCGESSHAIETKRNAHVCNGFADETCGPFNVKMISGSCKICSAGCSRRFTRSRETWQGHDAIRCKLVQIWFGYSKCIQLIFKLVQLPIFMSLFQGSLCLLNASDSVGNMVTHVSYEQLRALRTTDDFLLPRQGLVQHCYSACSYWMLLESI